MDLEIIIIPLVAMGASLLTFFSGFGLGTLMTPVFALFFPVEIAIAMTSVVHFLNNIFKFMLIGRNAQREIFLRFGLPSFVGAILGSWVLVSLSSRSPAYEISIGEFLLNTSLMNLIIGILIILFAMLELVPVLRNIKFSPGLLISGGFMSGFFGGLSGHQGALRSAFLIKFNLAKEEFIATGIAIALVVDVARISVYGTGLLKPVSQRWEIVLLAILFAFMGATLGRLLLKKVRLKSVEQIVGSFLLIMGVLIILGLV